MTSLLIIDDHRDFRRDLRRLCDLNGGYNVLGEASTGQEAIALVRQLRPDVILLDIRLPDLSGFEVTRAILLDDPTAKILLMSMYRQNDYVRDGKEAGAMGFVHKTCDEQTLFHTIQAIERGESWPDAA